MQIVVFGASGPTGRRVVEQALSIGHDVTAVTRNPADYPLQAPRLRVVPADVTRSGDVAAVLAGAQAVVSTFGVPYSRKRITVYSSGVAHIIAGMHHHGITRLVCVTSTSIAPGDTPGESWFWRRVLIPVLRRTVGRTLYDDMQRMERIVRNSDLDWTIVRPGGLFDTTSPTADYAVSTQRPPGRMTSRADLAQTLLSEVIALSHPLTTVEVITRSQLPTARTFLRSTFGARARTS